MQNISIMYGKKHLKIATNRLSQKNFDYFEILHQLATLRQLPV